jgi:hypothetical protein
MTKVYSRPFFAVRALVTRAPRQEQFRRVAKPLRSGHICCVHCGDARRLTAHLTEPIHSDVNPTVALHTNTCITPVRLRMRALK